MTCKHIAYITVMEDLNQPLLRRQVLELLCEIKRQQPTLRITLVSFLTVQILIKQRKNLKQMRDFMRASGIRVKIIPSLVPWPLPHFGLHKSAVGYRPKLTMTMSAVHLLGLVVWPIMAIYYIFYGVRVFHCRSYPASYAAVQFKKLFVKTKILFDPRSDFPEENVTAGNWEFGDKNFLFWKSSEQQILLTADATACISQSYLRTYMNISPESNYFSVPNNVDCNKFRRNKSNRTRLRNELGINDDEIVFCYLGTMSANGWHRADVYARACEIIFHTNINCRYLFIIPKDSVALLRSKLLQKIEKNVIIISPNYEDVQDYLAAADYGLMFLHRSKIAVGTKIGEYLAAGLPVIANRNCIGAYELINDKQIGLVVGIGIGDLDDVQDLDCFQGIKKGTELSQWSDAVTEFSKAYFDNSTIAKEYYKQYEILSK